MIRDDFRQRIDAQVAAWLPRPSERRFDEIGWAPGVQKAMERAKALRRPLFLFTMDGRIQIGRC